MSRIKSKNTKPEMLVRKYLFSQGLRYRLHDKKLPGKPDLVLPKYGTVVFVHGCFWHGHEDCRYFVVPKTKTNWWLDKIATNMTRDKKSIAELAKLGMRALIVWECELKKDTRERRLKSLIREIK